MGEGAECRHRGGVPRQLGGHAQLAIDYAFYSKGASRLNLKEARVFDTRDSRGVMPSDHGPLMSTFEVK